MFREKIQEMIDRVDGALGGVVIGYDGITVESYTRSDAGGDIQTIGIQLAHVVAQLRRAAESLQAGNLREMSVYADRFLVLLHPLDDEYFLACAFGPNA